MGAGGHAREIVEVFLDGSSKGEGWPVLGYIDENPASHGKTLDGLPVLGNFRWFEGVDRGEVQVICAVGTPQVAHELVQKALDLGLEFCKAVSPLAHVSPFARLGRGVMLFAHSVINTGAEIGDFSTLNLAATVSHDTVVGPFCNINPGVHLAGNVRVEEGCYIGMGANIIQGVTIGAWSIIGAGTVVVKDIPPNVTAVGVPAKVIKTREEGWYER